MPYQYIKQCWNDFLQKKGLPITNKTPIPILWFGNYDEYMASEVKVLTVGLNPSSMEFKQKRNSLQWDVRVRFPKAASLVNKVILDKNDLILYKSSMSEYFTTGNDYWNWFKYNERILNALGASYKIHDKNRALHIDIYSPIATDPTWGGLNHAQKKQLMQSCGYDFKQFVSFLNPDIIVVSANAAEVASNFINYQGNACVKNNCNACIPNCNGRYDPYIRGYRLQNNSKLIWVKNCNGKPLMDIISDSDVYAKVNYVYSKL